MRSRLERAGWEPTRRWDFDLYWRKQVPSRSFFRQLPPGARINHIPGIAALTSPARRSPEPLEGGRKLACHVLFASVDPLRLHLASGAEVARLSSATQAAIRRRVVAVVAAAYDDLVRAVRDDLADRAACFEVLRFDLVVEEGDDPRLVRCVLSPPIDETMAAEVLGLLGILPAEPDTPTRFETLVPDDAGAFVRACPWPRWSDVEAAGLQASAARVVHRATSRVFDGALVLFQEETARFQVLNDTGGYLWLRTCDGATPGEVAADTMAQFGIDAHTARSDVWDALARWASDGWIGLADETARDAPPPTGTRPMEVGRCRLARSGVILGLPTGSAVALVGHEASGASAIAAVLAAREQARVLGDAPWVDEASAAAIAGLAKLAVYESDDAAVAALSASFAASPHDVAANEIGVRFLSPQPWEGSPPEVGSIVVVRRAARGAPAELRPLSPRGALLALMGLGMTAEPPWTTERAMDLLAWLEEAPAFELLASDVVSAADALLSSSLSSSPSAESE